MPVLMRGAQAALSPIFGALATPATWQAAHTVVYTCFGSALAPAFAAGAAAGAPDITGPVSILPTGARRAATAAEVIAFGSACGWPTTSCTSRTMPKIGTRNDATTTT